MLLVLRAPARALSLVLSARDAATEPVPDQYRTQGSKQRNKTYTNLTSLSFRCRCQHNTKLIVPVLLKMGNFPNYGNFLMLNRRKNYGEFPVKIMGNF